MFCCSISDGVIIKLSKIGEFIDAASNVEHPHHKIASSAMNQADEFTWNVHFDPQFKWINGAHPDHTHIVCYDSERLAENMQTVLSENLGITCDLSKLPRVNVTRVKDEEPLTSSQNEWLHKMYEDDFKLWEKHCKRDLTTARLNQQAEPGRSSSFHTEI